MKARAKFPICRMPIDVSLLRVVALHHSMPAPSPRQVNNSGRIGRIDTLAGRITLGRGSGARLMISVCYRVLGSIGSIGRMFSGPRVRARVCDEWLSHISGTCVSNRASMRSLQTNSLYSPSSLTMDNLLINKRTIPWVVGTLSSLGLALSSLSSLNPANPNERTICCG